MKGQSKQKRRLICVRVKQACEMLSIGRTTLYSIDDLPYFKMNSVRLYLVEDLEKWANKHKRLGGQRV